MCAMDQQQYDQDQMHTVEKTVKYFIDEGVDEAVDEGYREKIKGVDAADDNAQEHDEQQDHDGDGGGDQQHSYNLTNLMKKVEAGKGKEMEDTHQLPQQDTHKEPQREKDQHPQQEREKEDTLQQTQDLNEVEMGMQADKDKDLSETLEILDNLPLSSIVAERYGNTRKSLCKNFKKCPEDMKHLKHLQVVEMSRRKMKFIKTKWQFRSDDDCDIYTMRHMETDIGDDNNWDCGFKHEITKQVSDTHIAKMKRLR